MMRDIFGSGEEEKKTPFYLKIVDTFSFIYTKLGIDYPQMRTILEMKMKVDSRRESALQGMNSGTKENKEKNNFFSSLWIYTLISLVMLALFAYDNWVFQYTTYFSFIFIMIFSTMIANFSTILLDVKDSTLIGTKPVSKGTISAAKATHIAIYLIAFTLAIGLPVIVFTFYFNGIAAGLLVLLLTFLASLWCLGLTIFMYGTVLKQFDGERLQNIIAYSQIALSVFMVLGYYIMGQLFQVIDPETLLVEMNLQLGHVLLFPMWFVAPFGLLQEGFSTVYLVYTLLLILGTVGIGILYYYNQSKIEDNLQKMNSSNSKSSARSLFERMSAKILSFSSLEKAYFHFSWQLTKYEREFKTRLYPSFASALLFPAIMIFSELNAGASGVGNENQFIFLYMPYFTIMIIPILAVSVQFSKHYKGQWIFELSSTQAQGPYLRAVTKVMLVKFLLPLYLVISLVVIFLTGFSTIIELVNGLLLVSILLYFETKRTNKNLPFTRQFNASEANQGCMATLIFFVPVFIISLIMILVQTSVPYAEWVVLVLLLAINLWWMNRGFSPKKTK